MGHVLHLVPPDGIDFPACRHIVDAVPVSPGDDGGIVGGFCPALNFDAVNVRLATVFHCDKLTVICGTLEFLVAGNFVVPENIIV